MSTNFTFGPSDSLSNFFYNPFYPSETTFYSKSYYPCGREKTFPKHIDNQVDIEIETTIRKGSNPQKKDENIQKKTNKSSEKGKPNNLATKK